ncbi:hypothetical protein HS088_TW09G01443 [Tripterygium wilfordii]|uniref:Protein FAM33A n=1 Tax=Tripterygium wilfordii TaxID=458696 RepID=A0A7J7DAH3_TRIWF|nr:uncharacterized protein LOC120006725 [Tripterygium wilfordii]KAF5743375.1 hypothetical protein HS088_TW09G01443 [Tripterygium wilfordii]
MGHYEHHNQAVEGLLNVFSKANHELSVVQHKLEREFQQTYPDNANPMKLVSRIKKIQEDVTILKEQCLELLAAKQDLIDKAQTSLVSNRNVLQNMQAFTGIPFTSDSDDSSFTNFNQVINEWTTQFRSIAGNERHDSDSENINQLLFSAIVQNN